VSIDPMTPVSGTHPADAGPEKPPDGASEGGPEKLPDGAPMFPGAPTVASLMAAADASAPLPDSMPTGNGHPPTRPASAPDVPRSVAPPSPGVGVGSTEADHGAPPDPEALVARVQQLSEALAQIEVPAARAAAEELTAAIVELYGVGLERIFGTLDRAGEAGAGIKAELMDDGVVASLMLIHDLYPVDLETRVLDALDSVRPYMQSHGGDVEFLGLDGDIAVLRLQGSCQGCAASSATLELAIKQALVEHAPDLGGFECVEEAEPQESAGLFELPMVQSAVAPPAPAVRAEWIVLEDLRAPSEGVLVPLTVAGRPLVLANVEGSLLAYADVCAACGGALGEGELSAGVLACPACERRYFLPRAGRSLDDDGVQLEPVPLLHQPGVGGIRVKVALPG
jgi:Fe-S cluster biogenesis protein NfuA/nitrite reductase/ring-hydroxylating ferredoxin subunit